jgi:arabinofuranan 3-O-arabinosyltransferase
MVLRPGPDGGVVDLGQNKNPGWVARQDGRALHPVVLNGWQQGWLLRGTDPVVATYGPDLPYRIGLAGGLACLLVLVGCVLVLSLRRRRLPEPDALSTGSMSAVVCHVIAAAAAVILAGWPGLVLAGAVFVAVAALRTWLPDAAPWVLAAGCLAAAAGYYLNPWTDPTGWAGDETWPHYLALVPVLASVVLAARTRPRSLSRRLGASMSR